jgi:hypothetical protein
MKSKKQKRSIPEKEKCDPDFQYESNPFTMMNSDQFYQPSSVEGLQNISNISPKKNKKKIKLQNSETEKFQIENSKNNLQDIDLEKENILLEGFEGSELQKAFLFGEIFKNTNN